MLIEWKTYPRSLALGACHQKAGSHATTRARRGGAQRVATPTAPFIAEGETHHGEHGLIKNGHPFDGKFEPETNDR